VVFYIGNHTPKGGFREGENPKRRLNSMKKAEFKQELSLFWR
tara:strand:- start:5300 stop:5425 length:126 start_codon:yes stop_codon:yes gene_type:complete